MTGHVRERPSGSGRWYGVFDRRDPATGQRKRQWVRLKAKGKREARLECAELVSAVRGGTFIEPSKATVAEFLERWIEHMRSQVSPKTLDRYGELARKNIVPLLGEMHLSRLQPANIAQAYATALASGRRDGSGGLAPRTVHHMHRVLRQAVAQAVDWGILGKNPVDAVRPPRVEASAVATLDPEQSARLLDALRHSRVYWPTLLALATGMRRGEILALRWQHVDLNAGLVQVVESLEESRAGLRFKSTKNSRTRSVTLPAFAVTELRRLKREQAETLLRLGIRQTGRALVCGRADGEPHSPIALTYEFSRFAKAIPDLPTITFHGLRHSHATALLGAGVHPKIAQERLGHSSVKVTLDVYSHAVKSLQDEAASKVDVVLGGAINRVRDLKG